MYLKNCVKVILKTGPSVWLLKKLILRKKYKHGSNTRIHIKKIHKFLWNISKMVKNKNFEIGS